MTGQILTAFVATKSDLVAVIGTKVRPATGEQSDALPYVTYQEIDGQTPGGLDGPSGLADRRLQVNAVAASYGQAKLIARLLCGTRADVRFDGFKGSLTVGSVSVDVRRVRLTDMRDVYDQPVHGGSRGEYEVQMDFMVCFDEAAVTAQSAGG